MSAVMRMLGRRAICAIRGHKWGHVKDRAGAIATCAHCGKTGRVPTALPQVFVLAAIVVLQVLSFLVTALACGDDGPVDYGTASALQARYCHSGLREVAGPLFVVGLFFFVLAWIGGVGWPVLWALPFIAVSSLLPLALYTVWLVFSVVVVFAVGALIAWAISPKTP